MTAVTEPYDLDRLAEAAVAGAPALTAAQIDRLRNVLAPAVRVETETAEVAPVVALPVTGETEMPGVAA